MMNKAFLEDLEQTVGVHRTALASQDPAISTMTRDSLQLYIAEKLWSIEQILQHQGGR